MSNKQQQKKHPSEFLNKIEEWSENQYNPGYWTGGNIPPHIKHGGKLGGMLLLMVGILLICLLPFSIFSLNGVTSIIITTIIGIVFIIAGLKKIMVRKNR
jgi:hypothetical protein